MTDKQPEPALQQHLHRRTWEMELLISGAIVLALLKLPSAVDSLYQQIAPHVSSDLEDLIFLVYWPAKMTITPAIVIFIVHILLRGLWVGLVGLNAVFPRGILWERIDLGPIQQACLEEKVLPRRFQDQVDKVASSLFSVLFIVVSMALVFSLWCSFAIGVAGVAFALGVDLPIGVLADRAYLTVLLLILLPTLACTWLDQALARRNKSKGFGGKVVRILFQITWYVSLSFLWAPATYVLWSNLTRRKQAWWKSLVLGLPLSLLLGAAAIVPIVAPRFIDNLDSYVWAPDAPAEQGMRSRYYDSLRVDEGPLQVPSIPNDVPTGPWLRLFLPYHPRGDNPRLAELCSENEPFRIDGDLVAAMRDHSGTAQARQAALACFARLWTIELDGAVLSEPVLLFADGPDGRGHGVVTYLALEGLTSGRHNLVISRHATIDEQSEDDFDPDSHRFYIPFWR